jgi:hypothetical protein
VILEAAAKDAHPGGVESRGNGIACMGHYLPTSERESHFLCRVDCLCGMRWKSGTAHIVTPRFRPGSIDGRAVFGMSQSPVDRP